MHANGTTATQIYNHARRLTDLWQQAGWATITRHTYTLDANGNRTHLAETLAQVGGTTSPMLTYGYDRLSRLTIATGPVGTTIYCTR